MCEIREVGVQEAWEVEIWELGRGSKSEKQKLGTFGSGCWGQR